jgi:hypothetical protein
MRDYKSFEHVRHRVDRRDFLWNCGGGLGGIALAALLKQDDLLAMEDSDTTSLPITHEAHLTPRAKQVIQIFCPGAVSQLDTYDYKPILEKRHGTQYSQKETFFASAPGAYTKSYWKFRQRGESGLWMSDLLPKLARCTDDMSFIYSMQSKSALHGAATFMMNSGFTLPGFPAMGAWVTYGLGSENANLPSFVVLPDARGVPPGGPANWGAGFLPAVYQGTTFSSARDEPPILDLFPKGDSRISSGGEADSREFLRQLNLRHAKLRPGDTELAARISAYELAARLQLSAPEVSDLSQESATTKKLYGFGDAKLEPFGRQCLLARRLVERGVRFVQVWCGADNVPPPRPNWDAHEDIKVNHGKHGPVLDNGAAALLVDLKQRGLLEETLVMCTSEFGRQPAAQGKGRDHNADAFTVWLAGGGIKGGSGYGATDELGRRAEEKPCYTYDLHATALRLLGLNHKRLTFYHNGIERRLTDVHGHVLDEIIDA